MTGRSLGAIAVLVLLACAGAREEHRPEGAAASSSGLRCTRDGLVVRLAQFQAPAEAEPIRVEGLPEPPDAVEMFFNGPDAEQQPVFGGNRRKPEPGPVLTPRERAAIDRIIDGAMLQRRYPDHHEHHLFPRLFRKRFFAMGIDVDAWTILVDSRKHTKAHGQLEIYFPGGRWNREWGTWIEQFFGRTGRFPGAEDAFERATEMIKAHDLGPYGLLAPYGCGRLIAHDLYDIVEPSRR